MNVVANDETVAVISCIGMNPVDCNILDKKLKDDGFEEVLLIDPDPQDETLSEHADA